MAYILGYIAADGCLIKRGNRTNSWVLSITSKDKDHLIKISLAMNSTYPVLNKYNSQGDLCFHILISNFKVCQQLYNLGIHPKKTLILPMLKVPKKYFSHFVRGFFDGDGSVYIYTVNGTPQLKSSFVSASKYFINELAQDLSLALKIPIKPVYKNKPKNRHEMYRILFYIQDSELLYKYLYKNNPSLYLERKYLLFQKWKTIKRRSYIKKDLLQTVSI